jgi:hypothetical protein
MHQGDQASIIGGVVGYIKELQQVMRSLEAKKHRKAYADQVLSPRTGAAAASPRPPLVKSTPPISPRVAVPISPRTPTRPGSPYILPSGGGRLPHPAAAYMMMASPAVTTTASSSSTSSYHSLSHDHQHLPTLDSIVTELAAHAAAMQAALPDVKVEFAGPNLVLKTVSRRAPGQALKIIAALGSLSLEILHVSVSTIDDIMVHSFTIKVYNLLARALFFVFVFTIRFPCLKTMHKVIVSIHEVVTQGCIDLEENLTYPNDTYLKRGGGSNVKMERNDCTCNSSAETRSVMKLKAYRIKHGTESSRKSWHSIVTSIVDLY